MHTHTFLNFSIAEMTFLAFSEHGSTQGKKKKIRIPLILIVKLQLQDGKKDFFFPPQSRIKTLLVC